jgi:hypothetical protein
MHIKTAVRQGPARTSKQFFYNNLQGQDSKEELFSCRFLSNVLTGTCKKTDFFLPASMHIKTAVRQGPARKSRVFSQGRICKNETAKKLFSCRFLSSVLTVTCKKTVFLPASMHIKTAVRQGPARTPKE